MNMSKKYLLIQNPGTIDVSCFLILGASLADSCDDPDKVKLLIGRFGSGTKNAIAVLLRESLSPIVFSSQTRLDFHLETTVVSDEMSSKELERICVTRTWQNEEDFEVTTEKLGMTTDFGKHIWTDTALALREFVSNAIDFNIRRNGTWDDVVIELVEGKDIKQKEGYTQVYIPLNEDVLRFWMNLGKWFLHFSEPESLEKTVLLKNGRSFNKTEKGVIYRRGVMVRQLEVDNGESLFDYNLPDLQLDESRKADDYSIKYETTLALNRCKDPEIVEAYILNTDKEKWEYTFDSYSRYSLDKSLWQGVYARVIGDKICTTAAHVDRLQRKGIEFHVVNAEIFSILKDAGVRTYIDVLDENEIDGMEFVEVPSYMIEMYGKVWDYLQSKHLTRNKSIPHLRCFVNGMNAGNTVFGMYRNGQVYLKYTLSGKELFKTIVDELTHHITESGDSSRDYQEYLFDIIMCLVDEHEFELN